eukprot:156851_1
MERKADPSIMNEPSSTSDYPRRNLCADLARVDVTPAHRSAIQSRSGRTVAKTTGKRKRSRSKVKYRVVKSRFMDSARRVQPAPNVCATARVGRARERTGTNGRARSRSRKPPATPKSRIPPRSPVSSRTRAMSAKSPAPRVLTSLVTTTKRRGQSVKKSAVKPRSNESIVGGRRREEAVKRRRQANSLSINERPVSSNLPSVCPGHPVVFLAEHTAVFFASHPVVFLTNH